MILQTQRLILRPAHADDLMAMHVVYSAPAAMRYWSRPEHESIEETRDVLDALIATPTEFCIEHAGRVIGKAGVWRAWELGFLLHPDFWGKGLASEALQAVIPHIFATCPTCPALTAEADPRNKASLAVLGKLGFRVTRTAARTLLWRDEWCDSIYLELDRATAIP